MRLPWLPAVGLAAALGAAAPAAADVHLTLANGQVTLSAKNATVPQILAEWSRVGHTRIVNGERVTGAPLTIELTNVPEVTALEIVLRAASGYVLAPRPGGPTADASVYDRIYVIPTSSAPRAPAVAPPPAAPAFTPPRFTPGPQQPLRDNEDTVDDQQRRQVAPPAPPVQVQPVAPPPYTAPGSGFSAYPGGSTAAVPISPGGVPANMPVGTAAPGMMMPTPTPGQAPTTSGPQR